MTTKPNPLAVIGKAADLLGYKDYRAAAANLSEARAAVAELVEAAKAVNALSIQSEMHMKLRAALARFEAQP